MSSIWNRTTHRSCVSCPGTTAVQSGAIDIVNDAGVQDEVTRSVMYVIFETLVVPCAPCRKLFFSCLCTTCMCVGGGASVTPGTCAHASCMTSSGSPLASH